VINAWNRNNREIIKDLQEIYYKMFASVPVMLAGKYAREELFNQHYTIYSVIVSLIVTFFLLWVLPTLQQLQQPIPRSSLFQILSSLLLGCAVPFLALTVISWEIAVINLFIWVFTFILVIFYNYNQQELIKPVSDKIIQIYERYMNNNPPQIKDQSSV
jgi:uncharacterized protein YacL